MKFFKPEDFIDSEVYSKSDENYKFMANKIAWSCCKTANDKLKKEGIIVFSNSQDKRYWTDPQDPSTQYTIAESDLRATLINIQPTEECSHPEEKVFQKNITEFKCKCGVYVKPVKFEEVK